MKEKLFKGKPKRINYEGRFLRFVTKGRWEYVERHNCSAIVLILAVTKEDELIFVEQYRPPVNKRVIEFPAGLVNDEFLFRKESLYQAASRELEEETGYRAQKFIKILKGPVSPGLTSDQITMLKAVGLKKISNGGGVGVEDIRVHKVPLKKVENWLKRMNKKGYFIEPKIYAGLYFLQKNNNR